jgi:cell division protein FtsW (lipid II flippase)
MKTPHLPASPRIIQRLLLALAAFFVFTYSLILTLAPAARARTWDVEYRWSHWAGFAVWLAVFALLHVQLQRRLPDADPYLLPIVALLSGWGLLTIWRLLPGFGLRQAVWLLLSGLTIALGLRLSPELGFLRRYKYVFLTAGILLTALTFFFGANPSGSGLRLWLGCCGIYLQPSEPLKLLFLIYLAAYLSEMLLLRFRLLALVTPTAIITGLALLLLVGQRDLGTASIFIFLYTVTLYIASGRKRVLWISLIGLAVAGAAGYFLFDVIRLRVEAWLNPWLDPAGRSYQIVQSLMAIANGGVSGRGPGLGSPGLVPVATSDFIYTAIAEETGLAGTLGLLLLIGMFTARGLITALRAPDTFRRILAAGLTAYIAGQSILIIGGNTRLLPLTGVTLPFVSYGGSSLLTSFIALLLLLLISNRAEEEPAPLLNPQPFLLTGALLGLGLLALAAVTGWWALWRGPDLLTRTDNARRAIADRYVRRGALLDRREQPINLTEGSPGNYARVYTYPDLSPVVGYTHPNYGQSGLEASLDAYLRGLQGNPASLIWADHLLYGQPPPGLDIRLSLDLRLQARADFLLGKRRGAIVLMNAETGEILVMASHPAFDANRLDEIEADLLADPASPLLNRAIQGAYPAGDALAPFFLAAGLGASPSAADLNGLYNGLGFYSAPQVRLPAAEASSPGEDLRVTPLQMAAAAASLSSGGTRPVPRLAMAVNTPSGGWVILPTLGESSAVFMSGPAESAAMSYAAGSSPFWQWTASAGAQSEPLTWSLGGTLPGWQGTPVVVVVLLEEDYPELVEYIGMKLLEAATAPQEE